MDAPRLLLQRNPGASRSSGNRISEPALQCARSTAGRALAHGVGLFVERRLGQVHDDVNVVAQHLDPRTKLHPVHLSRLPWLLLSLSGPPLCRETPLANRAASSAPPSPTMKRPCKPTALRIACRIRPPEASAPRDGSPPNLHRAARTPALAPLATLKLPRARTGTLITSSSTSPLLPGMRCGLRRPVAALPPAPAPASAPARLRA